MSVLNSKKRGVKGAPGLLELVVLVFVALIQSCDGKVADLSGGAAAASAVQIVTTDLSGMTVGPVTTAISTAGGTPPLTFSLTGGALPSGLKLDAASGVISGTIPPSAANQTYASTITVTDAASLSVTKTYTGTISAGSSILNLYTAKIGDMIAGIAYSYPLVAIGGAVPYKFAVSTGTLPIGVSLDSATGQLSGTPAAYTANQSFAFVITLTDSGGQSATRTFVGTVQSSTASAFSIITGTLPTPTAGAAYGASIGITGGTAPFTFAISSGSLPSGLGINSSTGLISGTVAYSAQGSAYLFSVKAIDSTGLVSIVSYSGFVTSYTTSMIPVAMPAGTPGQGYNVSLATISGQAPYTYTLTSGSLPSGLSLSAGIISGTISQAEAGLTKAFTIKSTDANNIQTSTSYSLLTNSFGVTLTTSSLANAVESTAYTNGGTSLAATGGTGPYTYEYTGTLPTGVGLTSAGAFFGTPANGTGALAGGTAYSILVRARDAANNVSAQVNLTLTVTISAPTVDALTPTNAVLGSPYTYSVTATGGRSPYTYAVTAGSIPSGLSFSGAGAFSGIPTASATCPANQFTVRVTDALSQISVASIKCITTVNGVSISNNSFPVVVVGVSFTSTVTATGGTAPYTFSATGLPSGVSLNTSTGALSGFTNATVGDYTAYLSVSDSSTPALTTTRSFTFAVRNPLTLTAGALPRAAIGKAYNNGSGSQLAASGGQSPYTYSISSGSLPSGLSMTSGGLISGTPATSAANNGGAYTINIVATDALSQTSTAAAMTLNVTVPPKPNDSILPVGVVSVPYAYDLKRVGGFNDFNGGSQATRLTWTVTGLPAGLSYGSTTGRIYGTPTTSTGSPFTISVTVSDAYGFSGTKNVTMQVNAAAKTSFDLKSPHFSDPCTGNLQCTPNAHDISQITGNSQQFLIHSRSDTVPKSIQISKIDATGRVPRSGSNSFTVNIPVSAAVGSFGYIKVADIDQDGYKDIVFTDPTTKQVCVVWNMGGTVDTFGMPSGFSANNMDCFPIPLGGNITNVPLPMLIRNDLRADSTNYGKQDVIVSATVAAAGPTIYVLRNICALSGACTNTTTQRPVIFDGYINMSATTTAASTSVTVASTASIVVGMQISGPNLTAGVTTVSSITNGTTFVMSVAAASSGASKITLPKATNITGSTTSASTTVTTASTAGIFEGQLVSHANFPLGTRVVSFVTNTSITVSNAATATTGGATIVVYGPVSHTPQLVSAASAYMRDLNSIAVGWFVAAKPNLPTVYATSANTCPGILVAGYNAAATGNGYAYVMRQTWTGTQCLGDFQTHVTGDEWLAASGTPAIAGVAAEDFNNDGLSDVVVASGTAQTSSASLRVYLTAGGTTFTGGTVLTPQLQSRGTSTIGANKVAAYCIDGSSTCSYPALMASCAVGAGCLAILPNQCSTPGCTTPFEAGSPSLRIDYPSPTNMNQDFLFRPLVSTSNVTPTGTTTNGSNSITSVSSLTGIQVGQAITGTNIPAFSYVVAAAASTITINQNAIGTGTVTLTIPTVPTRNDVAFASIDGSNSASYFVVFPRNGSSSTDPLKGTMSIDSFPSTFLQGTDTGVLKLLDGNNDGKLDLFAFMSNQGFVNTYFSTSGSTTYDLATGPGPTYVSNPTYQGCPSGSANCFPDPQLSAMGVQQQFPNSYVNDGTMDIGDLNNDGYPDIVTNGYFSRGVAVAMGASTGAFAAPTLYEVGTSSDLRPVSIVIADLDQDGIQDIALVGISVSGAQAGIAYWMKGNGDGTFQSPQSISQILNGCTDPRAISAVDIDLDGRPELEVLCYTNQQLWVSRRNSSGTWVLQTGATLNSAPGSNGVGMKWGRVTSSGASGLDMAVVGLDATNSMRSILGITLNVTNGATGAFTVAGTPSSYVSLFGYPTTVEIADINGDGYGDFIVPMQRQVGGSNAGGAYYTCTTTTVGNCSTLGWGMDMYLPYTVTAGDVTGDGLPELFFGYSGTGRLIYRTINRVVNTSQ